MIAHIPIHASDDDIVAYSTENPTWTIEREPNGSLTLSPPGGSASGARGVALVKGLRSRLRLQNARHRNSFTRRCLGAQRALDRNRYVVLIDPSDRSVVTDGAPPPHFPTDFAPVFDA